MRERIRRIAFFTKSVLFTVIIHGLLLAALLASLWWPFSENKINRGSVKPIQAQVISTEDVQQQVDIKKEEEKEKANIARELEEKKRKLEQEIMKQEELEIKKKEDEVKKKKLEQEKKVEDEKLRLKKEKGIAEEKQQKLEAEKQRKEQEKQKEIAEQKKRKENETKRVEAKKQQKLAEEKRKREQALKDQLAKEQRAQTQSDAATALSALVDRIASAVENNWRRPLNTQHGLIAIIRVKVALNGEVLSANVVQSSGDKFFDQSGEIAIKKASPLPFPSDPKYYEFINEFNFKFSPDDF